MSIAIRYLSKLGHTKDIAEAMGEELGIQALSITEEKELTKPVDILFLGGAPYANVMDKELREYASRLTKEKVAKVVLFTTSNWSRRTVKALKEILEEKGIEVEKEYFYAHMLAIKPGKERAKEFVRRYKRKEIGE